MFCFSDSHYGSCIYLYIPCIYLRPGDIYPPKVDAPPSIFNLDITLRDFFDEFDPLKHLQNSNLKIERAASNLAVGYILQHFLKWLPIQEKKTFSQQVVCTLSVITSEM